MAFFGWDKLKNIAQQDKKQPKKAEQGNGPAVKCKNCGEIIIKTILEQNLGVCAQCNYHSQISARARINLLLDEGTFVEHDSDLKSKDILGFERHGKSYTGKLEQEIGKNGMLSAMMSGVGNLKEREVALGVTDSGFIAGSMGSVVGEKFTRLGEYALEHRLPLIVVSGSGGGARMHEGLYSLMQMAKTSAVLGKLREASIPYISVVTDSTMGGVWASWAALGDVIIGEPGAQAGFTGPRVIKTTINQDLPDGFQRSEFLLEHGQFDLIVERSQMREKIASILDLLLGEVPQTA